MGSFSKLLLLPSIVGISLGLYVIRRLIDFVSFHFIIPPEQLRDYRRPGPKPTYALITGANGGIGYGIALALLKQGFGVILLGRNAAKLDAAALQLRDTVKLADQALVKTIVLDPQTASSAEMDDKICKTILGQGLRVTILVNNVGTAPIAYPPYRELATYSTTDIDDTININTRFMAHLTNRMLPVLIQEEGRASGHRSLILNLTSGAKVGVPLQIMYSSTKAFNSAFSIGLSRELEIKKETRHIDVLAIEAGDVRSQGNIAGLTEGAPDSENYGRYIVERTDGAVRRGLREMTPYWRHHLNFMMLSIIPERVVSLSIRDIMLMKRDAMNLAMKPKDF